MRRAGILPGMVGPDAGNFRGDSYNSSPHRRVSRRQFQWWFRRWRRDNAVTGRPPSPRRAPRVGQQLPRSGVCGYEWQLRGATHE